MLTNGDKSRAYAAEKLTKQELFQFYQPEIKGMVFLICLYGGLLVSLYFRLIELEKFLLSQLFGSICPALVSVCDRQLPVRNRSIPVEADSLINKIF